MNFKSLIFLTFLLIAIVSFIYFFERHTPGTQEKLARAKQVFSFDEQSIVSITLTYQDKSLSFELIKEAGTGLWRFSGQSNLRANDDTIISLLTSLKFLTAKRTLDSSTTDLKALGLDTPVISIQFFDDKFTYSLAIGLTTAIGEQVYAVTSTSKAGVSTERNRNIVILDAMIKENLDLTFGELRTQDVMPKLSFVPDKITIERESISIEIEKNKDNKWFIIKPISRKADDTTVNELLISLKNMKIIDFLNEETVSGEALEQYALASPRLNITLYGGSKSASLNIGDQYNDNKRTYVKNSFEPYVYGIDSKATPIFFSSLFQFSARNLIVPDAEHLKTIHIRKDMRELILAQTDGQWRVTDPVDVRADENVISALLNTLRSCKINEYIVNNELYNKILSSVDTASYTFILNTENHLDTSLNYTLFEDTETNRTYIRDNSTDALMAISIDSNPFLPHSAVDFADPKILNLNRHLIKEFSMTDQSAHISFQQRDGVLFHGENRIADDDSAAFFSTLEQVVIDSFIAIKTPETMTEFELDKPSFELHFVLSIKTETGSNNIDLFLGGLNKNFRYGYTTDYPLVFVVEDSVLDTLRQHIRQCIPDTHKLD
ncbi:MAG: DUF4340 domain-containing protein [Candidatus Auribacterota bacterium]|jgi:hypothetical protein|nr:DUF4340 domain-containing protein [Candidatus Auribacterota bacterium]